MDFKKTMDKAIRSCDSKKYMMRIYKNGTLIKKEESDNLEEIKRKWSEYREKYGKYSAPSVYENVNGTWKRVEGF